MTRAVQSDAPSSLHDSLREYGRGIAGGLLFSVPLLYTAELWTAGLSIPAFRQILLVVTTFVLLLGYNRFAGLHHDTSWSEVVIDSVEELGLGVLISVVILFLLGQITTEQGFRENLGVVVIEAMVVAIGVSVGTAQLGGAAGDEEAPRERSETAAPAAGHPRGFAGELVIAFCGAVLFAANVAATEEIQVIAADASAVRLLGLAVMSLGLGGAILFYSNFIGTSRRGQPVGWADAIRGSVIAYGVALSASGLFLWYFGRLGDHASAPAMAQVVVLAFPAALGASAGKLLIQSRSEE